MIYSYKRVLCTLKKLNLTIYMNLEGILNLKKITPLFFGYYFMNIEKILCRQNLSAQEKLNIQETNQFFTTNFTQHLFYLHRY